VEGLMHFIESTCHRGVIALALHGGKRHIEL
jgi:hypothetical protein